MAGGSLLIADYVCSWLRALPQAGAQLLYRATRDGFSAADFWRCCVGKGPTLTLIKVSRSTPH